MTQATTEAAHGERLAEEDACDEPEGRRTKFCSPHQNSGQSEPAPDSGADAREAISGPLP